jgi:hypothetical protein
MNSHFRTEVRSEKGLLTDLLLLRLILSNKI